MFNIIYQEEKQIDTTELTNLYNDAGWIAYTQDTEKLSKAIEQSLYVLTARHNGHLVGLLRIVGDGLTIAYIQDILVLHTYQRQKIGATLIEKALKQFRNVKQKVLITDDNADTRAFYEFVGFESSDKKQVVSFIKFE
ncbi:MAG: GNAT family N-acetyltransferase [Chitinophagales bacterium]